MPNRTSIVVHVFLNSSSCVFDGLCNWLFLQYMFACLQTSLSHLSNINQSTIKSRTPTSRQTWTGNTLNTIWISFDCKMYFNPSSPDNASTVLSSLYLTHDQFVQNTNSSETPYGEAFNVEWTDSADRLQTATSFTFASWRLVNNKSMSKLCILL